MGNKQAPQSSTETEGRSGDGKASDYCVHVTGFVVCLPRQNSDESSLIRQLMKFEDNPLFNKLHITIKENSKGLRNDRYEVKTFQGEVFLKQQHYGRESGAHILQRLSATYCERQVQDGVPVWLSPSRQMANPRGTTSAYNPEIPRHEAALSKLAFGTFDGPCSFKYLYEETSCASSLYKVVFHFDKGTMQLYCEYTIEDDDDVDEWRQQYRLDFTGRSLHRIVHVTNSGRRIDAFFQTKHPPLIYELLDEKHDLWSRRSCLPIDGIRGDILGRCDVVRLSFDVGKSNAVLTPSDMEIIYRNLQSRISDNKMMWDFRFTHVRQEFCKISSSTDVLDPYDTLTYPKAVLYSLGLRGQLLLKDVRLKKLNAEKLYHIAERYETDSQYYLLDVDRVLAGDRGGGRRRTKHGAVRNVILTPTRMIFKPPLDGEYNRIFREHGAESALKVLFRDEDIYWSGTNLQNIIFHKDRDGNVDDEVLTAMIVERLNNGIRVDGCTYRVLGGSNSLIKDHGYYLWTEQFGALAASKIRESIGDLHRIRNPAKYVARLGLAFSQTAACIPIEEHWIIRKTDILGGRDPDGNQYNFSDGIGKISPIIAWHVHSKIGTELMPSAFQVRMGGVKGVLAVDPTMSDKQIVVRDSMVKFESDETQLEVVAWSRPLPLNLNRQIVTLLSQLGVPDSSFFGLMNDEIKPLLFSLIEPSAALKMLTSRHWRFKTLDRCPQDLSENALARKIIITELTDKLDKLKRGEKKQISIPDNQGRNMMGVLDETGQLEYGQVFIQYSPMNREGPAKVVTGPVIVSKMPALHPGDVRKLEAVAANRVPGLQHMCDVIVFPRKGRRPHPNEMAGSDLDGDLYFVVWREDFLLSRSNVEPMHFPTVVSGQCGRPIDANDIIDFLKFSIEVDLKGKISNRHMAFANLSTEGIFSKPCIELAHLAAQAFDAPKTGVAVVIPPHLNPPGAPDFMEKGDHKPMYDTLSVLNRIYHRIDFIQKLVPRHAGRPHVYLQTYEPSSDVMEIAQKLMDRYTGSMEDMKRNYGIDGEEQLWVGRFPTYADFEKNRINFNKDFNKIQCDICDLFRQSYLDKGTKKRTKRDIFQACLHLSMNLENSEEVGMGLPWMLLSKMEIASQSSTQWDAIDEQAYSRIGSTVVRELRMSYGREPILYLFDYFEELNKLPNYLALFDRHPWLALTAEFVLRRTHEYCTDDGRTDVFKHVVLCSLKNSYYHVEDLMSFDMNRNNIRKILNLNMLKTYSTRLVRYDLKSRLVHMMNGKEEVNREDLGRIGRVVISSAWDIYDQRKGSVTEKVKLAALQIVMDIAFRCQQSLNADVVVQNEVESRKITEYGKHVYRQLRSNEASLSDLKVSYKSKYQLEYVNIEPTDTKWSKLELTCHGEVSQVDALMTEFRELCRQEAMTRLNFRRYR